MAAGEPESAAAVTARRLSGAAIGLAGAIGAAGGLLVNPAFRAAYAKDPVTHVVGSGASAFVAFLVFYGVCAALTYGVYVRPATAGSRI